MIFKERTDISPFLEGVFESVFVELVSPGEGKKEIIGVIYRPPGGDLPEFNNEIKKMLPKLRGANAYIMGDYNVDLLKADTHRPIADYLDGFYTGGFYRVINCK